MKHVHESPALRHQRQVAALQQQLFCIEMVRSCSDLIDELQRERGLSLLALSPRAESYAAAWREQVGLSCEAELILRKQFLEAQVQPPIDCSGMSRLLQEGLDMLNSPGLADLIGMRRRVLLASCSRQEAFTAYSTLLAQLLGLVSVARMALRDDSLEQELGTLEQLMLAKEYSGQERGYGSGLLASGLHDAQAWRHILALTEAQHRCASHFISQARPGARKRFKETLSSQTQRDLEVLRQRLDSTVDGAELEPTLCEIWFCTCSRRVNELREVERSLLEEIRRGLRLELERLNLLPPAGERQLTAAGIETVLRTAAAWLADASPGARPQQGRPA